MLPSSWSLSLKHDAAAEQATAVGSRSTDRRRSSEGCPRSIRRRVPADVRLHPDQLGVARRLARAAGACVFIHFLVTSLRARGRDLAILKTFRFTRRQTACPSPRRRRTLVVALSDRTPA